MTLLCKKIIVAKSKEMKTGWCNSKQPGKLNKDLKVTDPEHLKCYWGRCSEQ
jgi:hypothetical protein